MRSLWAREARGCVGSPPPVGHFWGKMRAHVLARRNLLLSRYSCYTLWHALPFCKSDVLLTSYPGGED